MAVPWAINHKVGVHDGSVIYPSFALKIIVMFFFIG